MKYLFAFVAALLVSSPVLSADGDVVAVAGIRGDGTPVATAQPAINLQTPQCKLNERASVNINLHLKGNSVAEVKKNLDDILSKTADYVKKEKFKKFEISSSNFQIDQENNGNDYGNCDAKKEYNGNGNYSYEMRNSAEAMKLIDYLASQKIDASLSISSNKSGYCPNGD